MNKSGEQLNYRGHQPGLDGIRGLAICGVMAVHFFKVKVPRNVIEEVITRLSGYGGLGVELFFVLSGFLITGILLDSKTRPNFFRNFYARRTLRIFPLYYGVLAVFIWVVPFFLPSDELLIRLKDNQVWLWSYTANFYISHTGEWSLNPVSHFWTLAIEEHFYIFWPLIVYYTRRQTLTLICVGVMIMALSLRFWLVYTGVSGISITVLTPCSVDSMCVGGLFACLLRQPGVGESLFAKTNRLMLPIAIAVVLLSVCDSFFGAGQSYVEQIRKSVIGILFASFMFWGLNNSRRPRIASAILENRALCFLGKYSYGLYVYHGILSWYLPEESTEQLALLMGNHTLAFFLKAFIGVSVSLIISVVSFELFEKRFLRLKQFFENRQG